MLLDKPNIELLKLIAVCKDYPVISRYSEVYLLSKTNTETLLDKGLLCLSRDQRRYRVTNMGYDLLNLAGFPCQQDMRREANELTLLRREQSAQVMLTLLLAGVDVFVNNVSQLTNERSYIQAGMIRRLQRASGRNVSGNTRFTGLAGGSGYAFYYITDPHGKLFYQSETRIVSALLSQSRRNSPEVIRPAVVYMGDDYTSLCNTATTSATTKATYRTAFDNFKMPVYLCPCNPDGAFQMRIMLQPDYRKRLIEAMLGPQIPNPFYQGCDGTLDGDPFILAVDMDLRRITGMVNAARNSGAKAHVFARRCQCDTLRGVLSGSNVKYYAISDDDILRVYSFSSFLKEPPIEPYITKGGEYIHDETIRACREARKANRKKGKASKKEN